MIKLIGYTEAESYPGRYSLTLNYSGLHLRYTEGSFNLIFARLLGMTYPNFLRYCRDVCGADLVGKGNLYVVPYFSLNKETYALMQRLNENANKLMFAQEGE